MEWSCRTGPIRRKGENYGPISSEPDADGHMRHIRAAPAGYSRGSAGRKPLQLTRRSSLALLAYLSVTGGTHPRALLTALFGGDGTEDQARRRLSNALTDLRQQLSSSLPVSWQFVGLGARSAVHV